MIDMADSPAHRGLHLLKRGERMTGVATDAALTAGPDKGLGPSELGSDGCGSNRVGVSEILVEFLRHGGAYRSRGMTAACFTSKVRPVEVCPEDASALRALTLKSAAKV